MQAATGHPSLVLFGEILMVYDNLPCKVLSYYYKLMVIHKKLQPVSYSSEFIYLKIRINHVNVFWRI